MVERGQEVETVCCLPIREAATSSDVWAMLTRERLVLKSLAPSGLSGVSGLSVQSLVVGEFRYEQMQIAEVGSLVLLSVWTECWKPHYH